MNPANNNNKKQNTPHHTTPYAFVVKPGVLRAISLQTPFMTD